jgi:hypothetical protein
MKTNFGARTLVLSAAFLLLIGTAVAAAQTPQPAPPLKPEDVKKILLEIAGDYDFDFQGQFMTVNFFEKDAALYGAPVGETPEVLQPASDSPLKFSVSPNGLFYELFFFRNYMKVIDRCLLKVMGAEVMGMKQIKEIK